MKKKLLSVFTLLVILTSLFVASPVMGATEQTVIVTFQPSFLGISNSPSTWNIGSVSTSTNYTTGSGYFTCTNTSSVSANLTISTTNSTWTGTGTPSTHSDTATAGADQVGMTSSNNTGAYDIIVKNSSPNKLYENLPATTDVDWELRFVSATSYSDGNTKGNGIVLTISRP